MGPIGCPETLHTATNIHCITSQKRVGLNRLIIIVDFSIYNLIQHVDSLIEAKTCSCN